MKYLNVPTKEGGYFRTGSRTPMQWSAGKNLGFSTAASDKLYLPVDDDKNAPTVEAQEKDANSLLSTVKEILSLRHCEDDLQADAEFVPVCTEENKPFVYKRGKLFCMVNTTGKRLEVSLNDMPKGDVLYKIGDVIIADGKLVVEAQSFAVMR